MHFIFKLLYFPLATKNMCWHISHSNKGPFANTVSYREAINGEIRRKSQYWDQLYQKTKFFLWLYLVSDKEIWNQTLSAISTSSSLYHHIIITIFTNTFSVALPPYPEKLHHRQQHHHLDHHHHHHHHYQYVFSCATCRLWTTLQRRTTAPSSSPCLLTFFLN